MFARTAPWPLVALFTAGYLAPYLLPTTVGRLDTGLPLSATQAGAVGSALLLSSATAGFLLASRVDRVGARPLARLGLLLAALGYGTAALTTDVPVVVAGAMVGGFGSGTATTVAATRIAAERDPHRASTLGLLTVSALAGAVYLTVPHLGRAHGLPLAAIALTALAVWPLTSRLPGGTRTAEAADGRTGDRAGAEAPAVSGRPGAPLPRRRSGLVLAAAIVFWSLAQNSLWGVSGRIGLTQAHLSDAALGVVFAVALGAGLLGVLAAGALGARLGRAVPIGAGTVLIAGCIALTASATGPATFAAGEIAWNTLYPVVLSYLIGLAASLDPRGRWAVLVGSASSLGTAAGPLTGSALSAQAGYPGMGLVLGAGLLLVAVPMTAVAVHTGGRPLLPGAVRRRGGHPAAVVAAHTGTPSGAVPEVGAPSSRSSRSPWTPAPCPSSGPTTRPDPGRRRPRRGPEARARGALGPATPEGVRLDLREAAGPALLVVVQERGEEGVPGQLAQPLRRQAEGVAHGVEVVAGVAAEVGRVVGVDGAHQAGVQHGGQRMLGEGVDGAQPDVGQRAQGQRDPLAHQPLDQRRVLQAAQAVVDALDAEHVERLGDVLRRALLAGVRDPAQPEGRGRLVDLAELRRGMADLGGVQADAGDPVEVGLGQMQCLERRLGGLVAQEAHDQPGGDAVPFLAAAERPPQSLDHRVHADAPGQVGLRIEEDLGVPHALRGGAGQIGVGEVREVPLGAQDGHQLVVQVQEGLEVGEAVGLAQGAGVGVGQGDTVAVGQLEGQLRFQGAFDVQVQFGYGQGHQCIVRRPHRRFGTATRSRSCATVSSPSYPAARACRSNSPGSG